MSSATFDYVDLGQMTLYSSSNYHALKYNDNLHLLDFKLFGNSKLVQKLFWAFAFVELLNVYL